MKTWKCSCGKIFNSEQEYNKHIKNCSGRYSVKREQKNSKPEGWKCPRCGKILRTRRELQEHMKIDHVNEKFSFKPGERDTCQFCGAKYSNNTGLHIHEKYCELNPNGLTYEGHKLSKSTKKKISDSQKERHKQGLATNWGETRRNINHHSAAEVWLIEVLKTNFKMVEGKDYITEEPYHGYFLDFLWPKQKLVIEMDGDQHINDPEQIDRDRKKDAWLKKEGFHELRIPWGEVQRPGMKPFFINEIKRFLTSPKNYSLTPYTTRQDIKKQEELRKKELIKQGCVDKNGRLLMSAVSTAEWEQRANMIMNCGVDITKYGWQEKVSKKTGLTKRQIYKTVERIKWLKNKVYRRK